MFRLVAARLRVLHDLTLGLIEDGIPPAQAVRITAEQAAEIPWEPVVLEEIGQAADRWVTQQTATELRPRLADPAVRATLTTGNSPETPLYVAEPESEVKVRRDAANESVTINGTEFRPRGLDRVVVLADRSKLEERYARSTAYKPPGRHTAKALRFGDYVDVNEPVSMLSMDDPEDFRQGYKVRALSDRGFGVVPIEVPAEERDRFQAALGAPAPTQQAVRQRAGERMVDARAWATGIIGRGRSIEREYLRGIDEAVRVGQREGQGVRTLTQAIRTRFKVAEGRARFIARDGLGTLNASITRQKHERLGFQFYRWLTSDDSRVRPEHRELHNTIRSWSTPHPTEGHPGEAPNCRCVAIPVTVDEYQRERRANRARAVAVTAVGVGAAVVGGLLVGRALRRVRAPAYPSTKAPPATKPQRAPVPLRPAARGPAEEKLAEVIRLPTGGREVMRRNLSARFQYAHQITRKIREADRAAGRPLSDYATTFGAANKAIRKARTDAELMERLAKLAGDRGQVVRGPARRVKMRKGSAPVRRRGKARNTRRNR